MSELYVVGTPIGNLSDFSPRAVETLKSVDFIAAEDTRVSLKLLTHFGIQKPLISYHEHNLRERGEYILNRIENGEKCAIELMQECLVFPIPVKTWFASVQKEE